MNVESSKWYTREMKRQAMRPVSGSRTVPTAKLVNGSWMRGRSRSTLLWDAGSILNNRSEESDEIIWSYNTPDETGGLRSSRIF